MKKMLLAAVTTAIMVGCASTFVHAGDQGVPQTVVLGPDSTAIRYSPRNWDFTKLPYEAATICAGSFMELNVTVDKDASAERYLDLSFEMSTVKKPLPTVGIAFDGVAYRNYPMSDKVRVPLDSLAEGRHLMKVTLVNLNEGLEHWKRPFMTGMMFRGISVTGASVGPKPSAPEKQILFVGDSITQGVRSRSAAADYTSSVGDDSTLAYPTLTAAALGYDLANVGFGRLGINVVGNGGIPIAPYSVGYVCDGIPVDKAFQPGIVVINLGTNDGNPDNASFDYHYKLMLSTLRSLYRTADIVCMVPFGGFAKAQVVKAVQGHVTDTSDDKVTLVDATKWIVINKNWKPTEDTSDGIHPNQQGHIKASEQLLNVIANLNKK